jgi:hypothetical protein
LFFVDGLHCSGISDTVGDDAKSRSAGIAKNSASLT